MLGCRSNHQEVSNNKIIRLTTANWRGSWFRRDIVAALVNLKGIEPGHPSGRRVSYNWGADALFYLSFSMRPVDLNLLLKRLNICSGDLFVHYTIGMFSELTLSDSPRRHLTDFLWILRMAIFRLAYYTFEDQELILENSRFTYPDYVVILPWLVRTKFSCHFRGFPWPVLQFLQAFLYSREPPFICLVFAQDKTQSAITINNIEKTQSSLQIKPTISHIFPDILSHCL